MKKTVKLRVATASPDVFDPSIEGVEPITQSGTPVPADKAKEVRAAAKQLGIVLKSV